jgi:hypothetical protein
VTRRLNLVAAVRYNHYRIESDFSTAGYEVPFASKQTASAGNISGNVGFNWRPTSGWLLRVNYARGFRAPNVDDMGKLFDSADGCVTVPNPALEPEYVDNIELSVAKHFGSFLKAECSAGDMPEEEKEKTEILQKNKWRPMAAIYHIIGSVNYLTNTFFVSTTPLA